MKILYIYLNLSLCLSLALLGRAQAQGLVEDPQACYEQKKYPCAVRVLGQSSSLRWQNSELQLSKGSALLLQQGGADPQLRLLMGTLFVRTAKLITVTVLQMQVHIKAGDAWLTADLLGQSLVRNLQGELQVSSPFLLQAQNLSPGFENWYGTWVQSAELQQGIARPISPLAFIKEWQAVVNLSAAEMQRTLTLYKKLWQTSAAEAGQLYGELAQRRVASVAEIQKQHQEELRRKQQKQAQLQQMFHQRFYDP